MRSPKRSSSRKSVRKNLRVLLRKLRDDPEALELVARLIETLAKRSPIPRR